MRLKYLPVGQVRKYYAKGGKTTTKKRDYAHEYATFGSKPEEKKRRAQRNAARAKMIKAGKARKGDGKDVHHKNRNPHDNSAGNLSVTSRSSNRAWRKGKKGYG